MKTYANTLILTGMVILLACGGDDFEGFRPDESLLFDLNYDASSYLVQSNFVEVIDNPWFAQIPGTIRIIEGQNEDGELVRVIEEVLTEPKTVMGIRTTQVLVQEFEDGELVEETHDWYAQDIEGNVWYFGEAVDDFEKGKLSGHDGAWEGGVDGAIPGILMPANPEIGMFFRQEYYENEAEDLAEVVSLTETLTVPYGTFENVLKTKEWNPLEKNSEEYKYWVAGVGFLRAESLTNEEFEELVSLDE